MEKKKKMMTKTIDLPVTSRVGSNSRDKIERSLEQEKAMVAQDLQETERLTAKNSVEEYIYGIREKIGSDLETYLTEEDR
jgi:molecular chaperone DnaK (HSP70)